MEVVLTAQRFYCDISRKKPLPLVGEMESSLFKLVRLSAGASVRLDHEIRSELSCTTKLVEGMSQESARLLAEDEMLICGVGVVWLMKIFVVETIGIAKTILPSADETNLL